MLPLEYIAPLKYFDKKSCSKATEYPGRLVYLLENGYLGYAVWRDALPYVPVSELRAICKAHGLSTGANREAITQTLLLNIGDTYLENRFSNYVYVITDKGRAALSESIEPA